MKLPDEIQFLSSAFQTQKTTDSRMDGKVSVITGATSGVGYHAAKRLAKGGSTLILVCRNADKAEEGEAAEYLLAEVSAGRLPREVVRCVLDGVGQARAAAQTYPDGMTPREAEVLRELARGKTNKEIARTLDVAPKTVDNHLQNLYRKIGAQSRAAAAMYAFEQGIFST